MSTDIKAIRNSAALHSTQKSGYARSVNPARVEDAEKSGHTIPVATIGGRQEGRVAPAQRRYKAGQYEAVTLEVAMARMKARETGKAKPIGLDIQQAAARNPMANMHLPQPEIQPTDDGADPDGTFGDVFSPQPVSAPEPTGGDLVLTTERRVAVPKAVQSGEQRYLAQRQSVTLELADMTFQVTAIDVIMSKYAITVLLPTDTGSTFVPKPGSELTVVLGDHNVVCYYPGASFVIPELKLMGLTFIRAEGET